MKNLVSTSCKKIVVVGGGTGTFVVLSALRDYPVCLSAIVTMADNGGSTGRLRDQYGVLPPGDVRRALVALSGASRDLREIFNYRFNSGELKGHSIGNIFLTGLEKMKGSFAEAVKVATRVLDVSGDVIPVTLDNINLCAELTDGTIVRGETNIDVPLHNPEISIKKVWLEPEASINPDARDAILSADLIVMGPGDLYTSLVPNLVVKGIVSAIRNSKAKKVYVCNLMTKYGETHSFGARDFLNVVEKYLGRGILDYAVFNNKKPSASVLRWYRKENAFFVDPSRLDLQSRKPQIILVDLLEPGRFIRHDPRKKLAKVLVDLLK